MKAIIVEDSRLAREGLKKLLLKFPQVELIGEAEEVDSGVELIHKHNPDVVFLDVDMPGDNGFALLERLSVEPHVIFTTAFSEFAARSFEFNTVDYLLKPINPERLAKAIGKLSRMMEKGEESLSESSQIYLKDRDENHLVELSKIYCFESCGNHTRVYFGDTSSFVYKSLSRIEKRLPKQLFFRANRQFILNLKFIKSLDEGISSGIVATLENGTEINVSRNNTAHLKMHFSL